VRRHLREWEKELPRVIHSLSRIIVDIVLFLVFAYGIYVLVGAVLAAHR
jgi:hypothetical protein